MAGSIHNPPFRSVLLTRYKGTASAYTYENMRGGSTNAGKYNRYDKMSCGFGVDSDGLMYISQVRSGARWCVCVCGWVYVCIRS